jgi:hypothetical protein
MPTVDYIFPTLPAQFHPFKEGIDFFPQSLLCFTAIPLGCLIFFHLLSES